MMRMKLMRTWTRMVLLVPAMCLALAACGDDAAEADKARRVAAAAAAFTAEQQAWREERRTSLLKPDGWSSLIGLHWINPLSHYIGSDADNGIRLELGPKHVGLLDRKGDQLRFVPESGVAVSLDGQPLAGGATLKVDTDEGGPSTIGFDDGNGIATVIKRADRYALRVKHANAPTRVNFGKLEYWPGGRDGRSTASSSPIPRAGPFRSSTSSARPRRFRIPARSSSSATARRSGSKRWTRAMARCS